MSAKQKFFAVREVVTTDYSGEHSTKTTEVVEVEVTWSRKPEDSINSAYGDWRLVASSAETGGEKDA